jgi:hypothetical protein
MADHGDDDQDREASSIVFEIGGRLIALAPYDSPDGIVKARQFRTLMDG